MLIKRNNNQFFRLIGLSLLSFCFVILFFQFDVKIVKAVNIGSNFQQCTVSGTAGAGTSYPIPTVDWTFNSAGAPDNRDYNDCTGAIGGGAATQEGTADCPCTPSACASTQATYYVQIDDASNFASPNINISAASTATQYTVAQSGLAFNTYYYWQSYLVDNYGSSNSWVTDASHAFYSEIQKPTCSAGNDSTSQITITSSTLTKYTTGTAGAYYDCTSASCDTGLNAWTQSLTDASTGLSSNTSYTYRVMARNSASVATAYGATCSTYTSNNTPTCSAVNNSTSQITVTQSGATNLTAGTSGAYYDCTGSGCDTGLNAWVQSSTDVSTGLSANTSYPYRVMARNGNSDATAYGAACSTYTSNNTPTCSAVNNSTSQITITQSGGANLTAGTSGAYYYCASGTGVNAWVQSSTDASTGLSANTSYTYQVKSRNGNSDETAYGAACSTYTSNNTPTCSAVNNSTSQITITQSGGANLTAGTSGAYYDCTGSGCDTGLNAWVQSSTDASTGLSANTSYTYQIKSRNGNSDETAYGATCSTYTSANTPAAPTVNTPTIATLNVNPVSGGAETSLAIYVEAGATCDGSDGLGYVQANGSILALAVWQADGDWSTVTVTGLSPDIQYSFCTKAKNGDNDETSFGATTSNYTSVTTPAAPLVNNPTTVTLDVNPVSGGGETSMAIYIEAGSDCNGSGGLGYIQADGSVDAGAIWQADGDWSTVTVTGRSISTQYAFCVKAKDALGAETGFGATTALYTLANTPDAPTVDTPTGATLNVNPVSGGGETAIAIYIEAGDTCDGSGGWYLDSDGSPSGIAVWQTDADWGTVIATELLDNTQYAVCAKAKNGGDGETSWSTTSTEYTSDVTPATNLAEAQPNSQKVGSNITFVVRLTDTAGTDNQTHICKTNSLTGTSCTDDSWCDSSGYTNDKIITCSYTTQSEDVSTSPNNFYAFVCDDQSNCSSGTAGTFTVKSLIIRLKNLLRLNGKIRFW